LATNLFDTIRLNAFVYLHPNCQRTSLYDDKFIFEGRVSIFKFVTRNSQFLPGGGERDHAVAW